MEYLILTLLIRDILQKLAFCALSDIWSRWSPPEERFSRAVIVTFLSYNILFQTDTTIRQWIYTNYNENNTVYYTYGILSLNWSVIWFIYVKNDPTNDNSLSREEKNLLTETVQMVDWKRNGVHTYPWRSILTSKPLWILCIVGMIYHVGVINSVRITGNLKGESELTEWLSISMKSLIYWSKVLFYFVYGYAADWLKKRINIGKFYMCFGFLGSAVTLILLQYTALQPDWAIICLLFTQSQVLFELVFLVNVMELSLRYSALLYGILNTFYQIAALIAFHYFAQSVSREQEQWFFYWSDVRNFIDYRLMVTIYVLGALIYWFCGSSKPLPLNRIRNEEFELTERETEQDLHMETVA